MIRLTRRDRAAMVLAYEELRSIGAGGAFFWHRCEMATGRAALVLPKSIGDIVLATRSRNDDAPLLLRARLALALRALLRADAGDCGARYECTKCGSVSEGWPWGCGANGACSSLGVVVVTHIASLWSIAPRTGEGRRPDGLRRREP